MNTKIRERFGKRLKELRESKDLTQEELAAIVNVHQTYIGKLETGKSNPSLLLIYKITKALDVSLYKFFEFDKKRGE